MLKKRFFKTNDECEVTFEYDEEGVEDVALVIESKDWQPEPMKQLKSGVFRTRVRLPKGGSYEYRFLVDGREWVNDADADDYAVNEYGGQNSVVLTKNGS